MLTPLQARIAIRTMRANRDISEEEFNNLDMMLSSADRENHSIALGIVEFKKKERIRQQLNVITGTVDIDIMNVDTNYLLQISNMAPSADRDKMFAMYLGFLPLPDAEKERLLEMLDSPDQESTYLAESIIIGKIDELQSSSSTRNNNS